MSAVISAAPIIGSGWPSSSFLTSNTNTTRGVNSLASSLCVPSATHPTTTPGITSPIVGTAASLLINLVQFWAASGGPSTTTTRNDVLPKDITMPYRRASSSSSLGKDKVVLASSSADKRKGALASKNPPNSNPNPAPNDITAARKRSALLMSVSMALHFFGYEFARSANLSLFTSKTAGFANSGAFPLAMACVSPFSVLLLMGYGRELSLRGPRAALRNTGLFCAAFLSLTGGGASLLDHGSGGTDGSADPLLSIALPVLGMLTPSKMLVWTSFIFQQSYAHLLYTQQWSFIGSVLTSAEGSQYFSLIAGLSSITSTAAGTIVSNIVDKLGLGGLLGIASLSLLVSMALADFAYGISEQNGFDPAEDMKRKKAEKDKLNAASSRGEEEVGLIKKTRDMFHRVPVLGALFCEVVSFQSLATILNVCMVTRLREAIADDSDRAAWSGSFYAYVNGVSGLFQFVLLPIFLKYGNIMWIWRSMPLLPLIFTFITSTQASPSLNLLAFSFFAAKVIDYSLRNVLNEMIYVPLDFDSRYLGKEVIGVFGNRFGKSGISLVLSGLGYAFGSFGLSELTKMTSVVGVIWFSCAYRLSNFIPSLGGDAVDKKKKKR